jgi:hypothetical protein
MSHAEAGRETFPFTIGGRSRSVARKCADRRPARGRTLPLPDLFGKVLRDARASRRASRALAATAGGRLGHRGGRAGASAARRERRSGGPRARAPQACGIARVSPEFQQIFSISATPPHGQIPVGTSGAAMGPAVSLFGQNVTHHSSNDFGSFTSIIAAIP